MLDKPEPKTASHMKTCVILNWNVQWASPRSKRFGLVRQVIDYALADVIVLTEGSPPVLPPGGYLVTSEADYGYAPADRSRRKVLLWSRRPWRDVDTIGSPLMPGGRFVAATTETAIGAVRMIGVCIPWRDAHVRTGRKDRALWEDHLSYIEAMEEYLAATKPVVPTLIAGDFNQRIPAVANPGSVADKLRSMLACWQVVTKGLCSAQGDALIDHVATVGCEQALQLKVVERTTGEGSRLSDHHGVLATLSLGQS